MNSTVFVFCFSAPEHCCGADGRDAARLRVISVTSFIAIKFSRDGSRDAAWFLLSAIGFPCCPSRVLDAVSALNV